MILSPNRNKLEAFVSKMEAEEIPALFIENFKFYYEQLLSGASGMIAEAEIEAVDELPDVAQFPQRFYEVGETVLGQTAVIKLNGGLGTSMGLKQAKSLLPVKGELTFLDIIAKQVEANNMPLVLMNSFSTDSDTLEKLAPYKHLTESNIPLRFLQHKEPKVRQDDFKPVEWPNNPALEWCPPGHGDIYTALITSGTLDALLDAGYKYAFVSNVDNLGAAIDVAILGYFADKQIPFMMEVADRTEMDKKGGHLARQHDGQLILRESAQCPDEDMDDFQNINKHKYFNTNNLWLNLSALKQTMAERAYKLGLPMIRNSKTVDPRDKKSTAVYQIETAMGSAIGVFAGAQAVRVPRSRFAPVKTTSDLLAVQSDAYELTEDARIVGVENGRKLNVSLDSDYYKLVSDFNARFPHGAPTLEECDSLTVKGDIKFGKNVVCKGDVELVNNGETQAMIEDNTVLQGRINY